MNLYGTTHMIKEKDRKRTYFMKKNQNGGIGKPNITMYMQFLKLSWINKIYTQNCE